MARHISVKHQFLTYVINSSSPTSSANEWDTSCTERSEVDLCPRILISTDDNTGRIAIYQ